MTDEDLRARSMQVLKDEELDYQSVQLPGGVVSPGHDRSYLLNPVFGEDFAGKSLLDVGSYLGYFCIEALRRGASEAVGIETDFSNVRKANLIAALWNLQPKFIRKNFEEWEPSEGERYDVVACLNVLHHLVDPIHAVHKMIKLARHRIVLEVATPNWNDVKKYKINPARLWGFGSPALFLNRPLQRGSDIGRTSLFTIDALRVLFEVYTNAFEPIAVSKSPFKGRSLVVAQKRRIGHLVVIAGSTASGKSTLAGRLVADPSLRQQLGLESGSWQVVDAYQLERLPAQRHEHLIFHYDLLRPSRTGMRSHERDPSLDIMTVAENVTVITVSTRRDRLLKQLHESESERGDALPRKKYLELVRQYEGGRFLADWYGAWEEFLDANPSARRLVVENGDTFEVVSPSRLKEIVEADHPDVMK